MKNQEKDSQAIRRLEFDST